jgi:hypothetical protein
MSNYKQRQYYTSEELQPRIIDDDDRYYPLLIFTTYYCYRSETLLITDGIMNELVDEQLTLLKQFMNYKPMDKITYDEIDIRIVYQVKEKGILLSKNELKKCKRIQYTVPICATK